MIKRWIRRVPCLTYTGFSSIQFTGLGGTPSASPSRLVLLNRVHAIRTGYLSPFLGLPQGSLQLPAELDQAMGAPRYGPSRPEPGAWGQAHNACWVRWVIAPPIRSLLSSELQLLSSHWPLTWKREGMCAGLSFLISKMEAWVFESSRRPLLEKKLIFFF